MKLDYEEILMLDKTIDNREDQINHQIEIKRNTLELSKDSEEIKKTIESKINKLIGKLYDMSEAEYSNIDYNTPFSILDTEE